MSASPPEAPSLRFPELVGTGMRLGESSPMRRNLLMGFALLLLGSSGHQDGLKLLLSVDGLAKAREGEEFRLKAQLTNVGQTPYAVVLPGDGSESGWREPHVYYSAEKLEGRTWKEVRPHALPRCGLYDPLWQDDVKSLAPGQTVEAASWLPGPLSYFDLSPGSYRFRLHYDYAGGQNRKGRDGPVGLPPDSMKDVAPFHLVSNEVEFSVIPWPSK